MNGGRRRVPAGRWPHAAVDATASRPGRPPSLAPGLAIALAAGLAAAALAGCSAGTPPECSFFSNTCNPTVAPGGFAIYTASVTPQRAVVQVGTPVTYTAQTFGVGNPSYQWRRSTDGGNTYTNIAGATASSYTLAAANLGDDGVVFRVEVGGTNASGAAGQVVATATLLVSAMPPVVYQDGDFNPAGWLVTALADPALAGPTHSEARLADGGHPGAFRSMVHTLPAGAASLTVFHAAQAAMHDPATQGAVQAIDYSEDCIRSSGDAFHAVASNLLIEQADRRYGLKVAFDCGSAAWTAMPLRNALVASDFQISDGPACASGEACPDFSASAPALRFGYTRSTRAVAAAPAGSASHGIDNWQVKVWRR